MDKPDLPVFFGEWVKKRRKALDLTQEELARRASCSVFALRKVESGERRPSKQLAELLAEALELSLEEKQTFIKVARGESSLERLQLPPLDASLASLINLQPASVSNRIPPQPTPLLGRDSELAAMDRLFKDPQCRLLTLTGMGGIGKTRLAIEFATRQQPAFPAGVYYVPLASIVSVEAIVPAMADVIGFVFSGPNDPKEQLINYITVQLKQSVLLVLDNLEHLLLQSMSEDKQDTAELISELLQRLPNIRILATSRERLNLQGEWTYELHGLAVPPLEFSEKLEDYSAVALFLQSASRVKADFEMTMSEQPDLIKICQLLDGTPLAIELAAAWVGVISCQEISQEIQTNIDFLTTSMRDIPERHRSLRATFDHSWKLLSNEERNALCRLSVFHGGFDRMAAEKIAGGTLPLLASLVSKSLVRRAENSRYDLHETIRQYAASHLEEDKAHCIETCGLHSEHFLNLASENERKLKSALQQAAMQEMSLELDNLRTAWEWGIRYGKFEAIGKAVRSFGWFYEISGLLHDGIEQMEMLVQTLNSKPRDAQLDKVLGAAFVQQGLLYFRTGQFVRAQETYAESIALLRSVGDEALLADALIFDGIILHYNGDYLEAREMIKEGLAYAQETNDQWFTAYGIYGLGHVESLIGGYQKGYEQMQEGLKFFREIGDPQAIALGLNFLVETLIKLERYEEAVTSMWESISLCERTKNRWGMGTAYRYLGLATLAGGQSIEAQGYFKKSLEIFGEYFEGWDIALSLSYLGDAVRISGDVDEAKKIYHKALRVSLDAHSIPITLEILLGLAHLYAQIDEPERAFELSYYILRHPLSTQVTKDQAREIALETEKLLTASQLHAIKAGIPKISLQDIVKRSSSISIR